MRLTGVQPQQYGPTCSTAVEYVRHAPPPDWAANVAIANPVDARPEAPAGGAEVWRAGAAYLD